MLVLAVEPRAAALGGRRILSHSRPPPPTDPANATHCIGTTVTPGKVNLHAQDPREVQDLYRDGVDAVVSIAESLDSSAWQQPACGIWSAEQTARHLLAVSCWYHEWLDRSIGGATKRPFDESEFDQQNEVAVAARSELSGARAVAEFRKNALTYLDRAESHWDMPFVFPFGTLTVGQHCGLAAAEWHLHAWDLSTAAGSPHQPAHPDRLLVAAGSSLAELKGGLSAMLLRRTLPFGARISPWKTMLRKSGRSPH